MSVSSFFYVFELRNQNVGEIKAGVGLEDSEGHEVSGGVCMSKVC